LKRLSIEGKVHVGEVSDFNVKKQEDVVRFMQEQYSPGDAIRGLVTSVDHAISRVYLSFRTSRIAQSGISDRLGAASDEEGSGSGSEEEAQGASQVGSDRGRPGAYGEQIRRDPAFRNPYAVAAMTQAYGIRGREQYQGVLGSHGCQAQEEYEGLRMEQNRVWARSSVLKGIEQMSYMLLLITIYGRI